MTAILDIMTSVVLGGLLMMTVINSNELTAETTSMYSGNVLVQEMIITQAQFIEREFRNMGAGAAGGQQNIVAASDSSITFREAQDPNGTVIDNITYFAGTPADLPGTQNEIDRYLYRQVNGGTPLPIGVITAFKLVYMKANGDTAKPPFLYTNQLREIAEIELNMEVQNPFAISRQANQVKSGERKALYSTSYWQQMRLASKNFRR